MINKNVNWDIETDVVVLGSGGGCPDIRHHGA